jgi:hypothetical protein
MMARCARNLLDRMRTNASQDNFGVLVDDVRFLGLLLPFFGVGFLAVSSIRAQPGTAKPSVSRPFAT